MTARELPALSTNELVDYFAEIALAQDEALLMDEYAKYNRLYGQMDAVGRELKSRPGDERRELMRLYKYENAQVRLKAAIWTLAVAPAEARQLLQAIRDSQEYPQAGDAGMSLWNLDRGVFKPT